LPKERYALLESINWDMDNNHVPLISLSFSFNHFNNIDVLLEFSKGKSVNNNLQDREGLVFKSTTLVDGQVLSFKIINNEYLLGEKE